MQTLVSMGRSQTEIGIGTQRGTNPQLVNKETTKEVLR
jgi:hypothetical protein